MASYLCLLPDLAEGQDTTYENKFLLELLVSSILDFMNLPCGDWRSLVSSDLIINVEGCIINYSCQTIDALVI